MADVACEENNLSNKVAIYCPHCHRHTALSPAPVDLGRDGTVPAIWNKGFDQVWWIGVCNYCQEPVLVLGEGYTVYPTPIPQPTDERVPETIRKDLDEAKSCMQVNAFCAAAVMARRVIQQSVMTLLIQAQSLLKTKMLQISLTSLSNYFKSCTLLQRLQNIGAQSAASSKRFWRSHVTIACNGAGGRVGLEINAYRAGPLMRSVLSFKPELSWT